MAQDLLIYGLTLTVQPMLFVDLTFLIVAHQTLQAAQQLPFTEFGR